MCFYKAIIQSMFKHVASENGPLVLILQSYSNLVELIWTTKNCEKKFCFWPGDKALKPVKKATNYETLQIRTEKIVQNAAFESGIFCRANSIKKSKYCSHPPFHPLFFVAII